MTPGECALNLVRRFNPETRTTTHHDGRHSVHTTWQGHLLTVTTMPPGDTLTIRIYREGWNNRVEWVGDMTAEHLDVLEEFTRQIIHNNHQQACCNRTLGANHAHR